MDCQAWYVNDQNLCKKRELIATDATELAGYLRYDAINKMIGMLAEEITVNKGRAAYAGKGGDETDKFLNNLQTMQKKYRSPRFWIMLEKEFKDDPDKLVSSVCKFDSSTGNLSYCGTICLQMNEEATLKPTTEFFSMILYNSDPNSKVYLRRFLNPQLVTKVSPSDDIEGINNFDIFVIQEGPKPGVETEGVILDYDRFIVKKVGRPSTVTCKSPPSTTIVIEVVIIGTVHKVLLREVIVHGVGLLPEASIDYSHCGEGCAGTTLPLILHRRNSALSNPTPFSRRFSSHLFKLLHKSRIFNIFKLCCVIIRWHAKSTSNEELLMCKIIEFCHFS